MQASTVSIDGAKQAQEAVRRAGQILAGGGLVVFPTETVYGVGALATHDKGYVALRHLKGRPQTQPFTVHLPDREAVHRYIDVSDATLARLLRKVFPGPVTLIVEVTDEVIAAKLPGLGLAPSQANRVYLNNTVGLRCPDHDLGRAILGSVPGPVVASSANRRGAAPPHDADAAARSLGDAVDLYIDGGHCRYAKPSTIIRVQGSGPSTTIRVERDGVYDERYIRKMLRWTLLLVCSGNTCRSPMAEGIARQMLAQQRGVTEKDLERSGVRVVSAGAFANSGMAASPEAVQVLGQQGIDLSRHRSRVLTPELIHEADLILTMADSHRQAVVDLVPAAAGKVRPVDPQGEVTDPIGAGQDVYEQCARQLRQCLAEHLKEPV